jgi:hypothetical protein
MKKRTFLYKEINNNREKISNELIEIVNLSFLPKFHKDVTKSSLITKNSILHTGYYAEFQQHQEDFLIYLYISQKRENATFAMGYKRRNNEKVTIINIHTKPNETIEAAYEELTKKIIEATIKQIFEKSRV